MNKKVPNKLAIIPSPTVLHLIVQSAKTYKNTKTVLKNYVISALDILELYNSEITQSTYDGNFMMSKEYKKNKISTNGKGTRTFFKKCFTLVHKGNSKDGKGANTYYKNNINPYHISIKTTQKYLVNDILNVIYNKKTQESFNQKYSKVVTKKLKSKFKLSKSYITEVVNKAKIDDLQSIDIETVKIVKNNYLEDKIIKDNDLVKIYHINISDEEIMMYNSLSDLLVKKPVNKLYKFSTGFNKPFDVQEKIDYINNIKNHDKKTISAIKYDASLFFKKAEGSNISGIERTLELAKEITNDVLITKKNIILKDIAEAVNEKLYLDTTKDGIEIVKIKNYSTDLLKEFNYEFTEADYEQYLKNNYRFSYNDNNDLRRFLIQGLQDYDTDLDNLKLKQITDRLNTLRGVFKNDKYLKELYKLYRTYKDTKDKYQYGKEAYIILESKDHVHDKLRLKCILSTKFINSDNQINMNGKSKKIREYRAINLVLSNINPETGELVLKNTRSELSGRDYYILNQIPRRVRLSLTDDNFISFDLSNSAYTIIRDAFKDTKYITKNIEYYWSNRKEVIDNFVNNVLDDIDEDLNIDRILLKDVLRRHAKYHYLKLISNGRCYDISIFTNALNEEYNINKYKFFIKDEIIESIRRVSNKDKINIGLYNELKKINEDMSKKIINDPIISKYNNLNNLFTNLENDKLKHHLESINIEYDYSKVIRVHDEVIYFNQKNYNSPDQSGLVSNERNEFDTDKKFYKITPVPTKVAILKKPAQYSHLNFNSVPSLKFKSTPFHAELCLSNLNLIQFSTINYNNNISSTNIINSIKSNIKFCTSTSSTNIINSIKSNIKFCTSTSSTNNINCTNNSLTIIATQLFMMSYVYVLNYIKCTKKYEYIIKNQEKSYILDEESENMKIFLGYLGLFMEHCSSLIFI